MTKIRTRIAPSPTSADKTLHLGNVRTALFAYLVAKKSDGHFVLRVEDSDLARNVPGCAEGMLEDLNWLGISPNEGFGTNNQPFAPYTQTEKFPRYKQLAESLIERGLAYKCVCTTEQLNKLREEAIARNPKAPFKYPGTCRNLKHDPDKDYVIRFKAPLEGETVIDDLVFGKTTTPNFENYDWVIFRSTGSPLYNLTVVVDDIDMCISHVIRGKDHLANTVQQIAFYKAFGANLPKFAHLPMVNNPAGTGKMSKRDGATSVKEFRSLGYSPGALLNYVARLGWGNGNQELFSLGELIELFDLSACGRNDGRFDPTKAAIINYEHLKSEGLTPNQSYAQYTLPFLFSRGLNHIEINKLVSLIPIVRYKCKTFIEAANELDPMLRLEISIDEGAKKVLTSDVKPKLKDYSTFLSSLKTWTEENIRTETQGWLEKVHLTLKDIGQPVRVSVFGRTQSPDLFKVMGALGKDQTVSRINAVLV